MCEHAVQGALRNIVTRVLPPKPATTFGAVNMCLVRTRQGRRWEYNRLLEPLLNVFGYFDCCELARMKFNEFGQEELLVNLMGKTHRCRMSLAPYRHK